MAKITDSFFNKLYGIKDSCRTAPYKNLNDVLNRIGVMAKQDHIPNMLTRFGDIKDNENYDYGAVGDTYFVPSNWRNCLYKDLNTLDYYIVSPHPDNNDKLFAWIIFKVTNYGNGNYGSFLQLLGNNDYNEVLDTLAKRNRPVKIKKVLSKNNSDGTLAYVYQLDI